VTLRVASILQQCTANAISALMAVNTTTQNWLKSINSYIVGKRWRLDHLVQIIVLGTAVDSTLSQTFFLFVSAKHYNVVYILQWYYGILI